MIRRFKMYRYDDVTGMSGVGVIAYGVQFTNPEKVALQWAVEGKPSSVAVWDSIEDVLAIHGHDGRTDIEWID